MASDSVISALLGKRQFGKRQFGTPALSDAGQLGLRSPVCVVLDADRSHQGGAPAP